MLTFAFSAWGQQIIYKSIGPDPVIYDFKNGVHEFRPSRFFKLSLKTDFNSDLASIGNAHGFNSVVNQLDANDYITLFKYNIQTKVYISKKFSILGGAVVNGIETNKYTYKLGVIYKF
jgi:hypothetical protein